MANALWTGVDESSGVLWGVLFFVSAVCRFHLLPINFGD
jgi:hypothetical protein